MNNPFLSDKNIFSKVTNPIKKTSTNEITQNNQDITEKKIEKKFSQQYTSQNQMKKQEKPRQIFKKEFNSIRGSDKITFGQVNQADKRTNFDRNLLNKPRPEMFEKQADPKDYNRIIERPSTLSIQFKNERRNLNAENYNDKNIKSFNSPYQDNRYEGDRKNLQFNDISPINETSRHKLDESEFINIDAMSDDLTKVLASSKNQEEICQLLGIEREKPKNIQPQSNQYQKNTPINQNSQKMRQSSSKNSFFGKQLNILDKEGFSWGKNEKKSEQYIPTFNNMDSYPNNATQHDEYKLPTFNQPIEYLPNMEKQISHQSVHSDIIPELYDYSKPEHQKSPNDIVALIHKQMQAISNNGKTRTFLTAHEKILTVKYNLQIL